MIKIYTDGSCQGNPGPGGWGAILYHQNDPPQELSGFDPQTTNNRMELTAAIKGLQAIPKLSKHSHVSIYTDSQYLKNGITQWLPKWKKNGWKTSDKKPVKNQDLWQQLDLLTQRYPIQFIWIKGHADNPGNHKAHKLATLAANP